MKKIALGLTVGLLLSINTAKPTIFTNKWQGPDAHLDCCSNGRTGRPTMNGGHTNMSGKHWTVRPARYNRYKLQNNHSGSDMCLDSDWNNRPVMRPCGNRAGQYWSFIYQGNYYYKIKNNWKNLYLDVQNTTGRASRNLMLTEPGNYSGQLWQPK